MKLDEVCPEWWQGLTARQRAELEESSDPPGFDPGVIRLEGWVVDPADASDDERMAQSLYDYVVAHDLVQVFMDPKPFHICRAHRDARAVIRNGRIPATFRCPLSSTDCPMRALLARNPGKEVRLVLSGTHCRRDIRQARRERGVEPSRASEYRQPKTSTAT